VGVTPTELERQIKTAPTGPGVYVMRDNKDRILYVGKAKNLRARTRAYLRETDTRYSVQFLMARVTQIEFIETDTEKEALLLENNLIKQHKPRYNIRLRDDKTYVSLRVNVRGTSPRVEVVRRYTRDGALYFGPYSSAQAVRETLRLIHYLFPIRKCSDNVFRSRSRPCLFYQIKQCVAPCVGYISESEYRALIDDVVLFLKGRNDELIRRLKSRMQEEADRLNFEEAARLRDRVRSLERTLEKQKIVSVEKADRDVFGMYREGENVTVAFLGVRGGKLLDTRTYSFSSQQAPDDEVFSSFLSQFYREGVFVPRDIFVPVEIADANLLGEVLRERRGGPVRVVHPQRGEKAALVRMANKNAEGAFRSARTRQASGQRALEELKDKLNLPEPPRRIECFDISNIHGTSAVGAMVVFEDGDPAKSRYRRFKIKSVEGVDDFGMMYEVLVRRYKRAVAENDLPDLVLIDGGKGHLSTAVQALKDVGADDTHVASIAKGRERRRRAGYRVPEEVYLPGRKNPVVMPESSPALLFLQRVRDEAHRFAISYHRRLRKKSTIRSQLSTIPGVGPKRLRALLRHFGSAKKVASASLEELAAVPGINKRVAESTWRFFHPS